MKKLLLIIIGVASIGVLAPSEAKAGIFIGLPVPVPLFYGPGYYAPGYYYGPYGYRYYPRPYWRHRAWRHGRWYYY